MTSTEPRTRLTWRLLGEPRTLTRQLVIRTAIVVGAVVVVLSVLITIAARYILTDSLDKQLDAALALQVQGPRSGAGGRPHGVSRPGMPPGTVIVQESATGVFQAGLIGRGEIKTLSESEVAPLLTLPDDQRRRTVDLDRLGSYRAASATRNGHRAIVALPLREVQSTTSALVIAEVVLGLGAVVAAILICGALVRRTVHPLNRLAETASEVSRLELHTGEVNLPVRMDLTGLPSRNEIAQVGSAFNHMLNNVEDALEARQASETKLRQFVADASHELRNPLAAIKGYSELSLRHREDLPSDTEHALSRIDAESTRMTTLVNDLLLLARLDSSPELAAAPVDVTEVVLNAVSDARAASPGHQWRLDLPDEPMVVSGESDRLHQVVTNLLSNARTHTPAGTTVLTRINREGADVIVRVIDDGPGIPPEQQATVFERFARGDAMRTHSAAESTGLGLAIVAAVTHAHGGRVWLTSRPGHTEFCVALPACLESC